VELMVALQGEKARDARLRVIASLSSALYFDHIGRLSIMNRNEPTELD